MPIAQLSSLLLRTPGLPSLSPTMRAWVDLIQSEEQFYLVCNAVRGIPQKWIDWTEREVLDAISRGVVVSDPLAYRLSRLLNGIINLQECKFITDVTENLLRVTLVEYTVKNNIDLSVFFKTIPDYEKFKSVPASVANLVDDLTFYQLTAIYERNWNKLGRNSHRRPNGVAGFWRVFEAEKGCRDVNRFRKDMRFVREIRNDISHSRRLFTFSMVKQLHRQADIWLRAVHVDIADRVARYRELRPNFLKELL